MSETPGYNPESAPSDEAVRANLDYLKEQLPSTIAQKTRLSAKREGGFVKADYYPEFFYDKQTGEIKGFGKWRTTDDNKYHEVPVEISHNEKYGFAVMKVAVATPEGPPSKEAVALTTMDIVDIRYLQTQDSANDPSEQAQRILDSTSRNWNEKLSAPNK